MKASSAALASLPSSFASLAWLALLFASWKAARFLVSLAGAATSMALLLLACLSLVLAALSRGCNPDFILCIVRALEQYARPFKEKE